VQDKNIKFILIINSAFVVLIELIGSLLPNPIFWGFNLLAYLTLSAKLFFIFFGVIIFIPKLLNFLLNTLEESSGMLKKNLALPLLLILYIPFYYIFHVRIHFLGDAPMILRMLPQMTSVSDMIATNEPGSYTIAVHVQNLLRNIWGSSYSPEYVFVFLSLISGIIVITVLFKYVDYIAENKTVKIFFFTILFFSPCAIFFLGYAETYQVVFVLMLSYMVSGVLYLRYGKTALYSASLIFGVWFSVHYLAAVFIPSFIVLLFFAFRRKVYEGAAALLFAAGSFFLVFLLTGLDFSEMTKRFLAPGFSHWLPLFGVMHDGTLPVLSFYHLLDVINSQLLASGITIFSLIALVIFYFKKRDLKDSARIFLLVICIGSLFFILFFNSHYGLSRDWDVAALMGYPFLFLFVYLINENFKPENIKKEMFLISYVSVWHVMLWLFLNINTVSAERRNMNIADERLWNANRFALYYEELGTYYRNKEEYGKAIEYFQKSFETNPHVERIALNLSIVYQKTKNHGNAEQVLKKYIAKSGSSYNIYFRLGFVQMESGKLDDAILNFSKALEINSVGFDALGNIAACYYLKKDYSNSIKYSGKLSELNPELAAPYISLGDNYLAAGDTAKADLNYRLAFEKDKESKFKKDIEARINSINK
jgi:tetratricopeptide (TPR) repeat protein